MSEGANMICPGCGAFQPRAEKCNKCGVIIAKATSPNVKPASPTVKTSAGKPPVVMMILAAVIAIPVLGYFLFAGTDDTATTTADTVDTGQPVKPAAKSQVDRIATINPAAADNLHHSQVESKLSALRTAINMYSIDNDTPLSNEEGLQSLVDKGVVTASDITDDWGNAFVYRLDPVKDPATGKDYTIKLFSRGPDGVSGTADDITI